MISNEQTITLQYALNPTKEQLNKLSSHSGAARYTYNWALNKIYENWEQVKNGEVEEYLKINLPSLRKLFNQEKDIIAPWWEENGKNSYDTGLTNAVHAFERYFKKLGKQPKYKVKRALDKESIDITTSVRRLEEDRKHFTITRLGTIKLHERATKLAYLLKHGGRITNVNLKYSRTRWFINVTVRVQQDLFERYHLLRTKKDKKKIVGVDVGIKSAAVFSDGTVIKNIQAYEKAVKKLRRLNKELSRRRKFNKTTGEVASSRYEKTRKKLQKQYAKVTNKEVDFAHKLSKKLVDEYEVIGLEDLNVAGMLRNRKLARRIAHASFGRLKVFTNYKAEWYGSELIMIDRFYPSSKTCSKCGMVKAKLSLKERVYYCDDSDCGLIMDRDLNAALNIKKVAAQSCGEAINGQGDESAGQTEVLFDETGSQRTDKSNILLNV